MPKIVERMGRGEKGSITGLLTILLDGDDPNEPVADTLRGLLDGHLFLDRNLAQAGHFPAVDVLQSLSRLMPELANEEHLACAASLRESLAAWKSGRDLVEVGAYKAGTNPQLDLALTRKPLMDAFTRQTPGELSQYTETIDLLGRVIRETEGMQ